MAHLGIVQGTSILLNDSSEMLRKWENSKLRGREISGFVTNGSNNFFKDIIFWAHVLLHERGQGVVGGDWGRFKWLYFRAVLSSALATLNVS